MLKSTYIKALFILFLLSPAMLVAQSDGFFRSYSDNDYTNRVEENTFVLPNAHGTNSDYNFAPLSSGLLIITALGAGYAISRKRMK